MYKKNPGRRSAKLVAISFATIGLLAFAAARGQVGPPVAVEQGNKQELGQALEKYEQAIEGQLYSEAADAGKLYISELLNDPNHDSLDRSRALVRLGFAQQHAGEIDAAIEHYALAIEIVETGADRLSTQLVEPLLGLSRVLAQAGDYRAAVASYKRALHVQQVNQGLYSLALADTVSELSEVYYRLGDYQRANGLQQSYVGIYQRKFPGDDLQQLPALYSRADMYYKTDRLIDSQLSYRRIISMIERADGQRSLQLLPAIYKISELLQNNVILDGNNGNYTARRFLRRAIYVAENHEGATNLDRADSHIALGDHLSLKTGDRRAAMRHYLTAWQQLSVDDSWAEERDARFGNPTLLNDWPSYTTPAMRKLIMLSQTDLDDLSGQLVVRYDVDANGRTRDLQLVEGDPVGYWDSIVLTHVEKFIFRPHIVDGAPAGSSDLVYEIRYSVGDRELPANLRQNGLSRQTSYHTQ
jgi:tetratricopeptide (TPR) repeat protein